MVLNIWFSTKYVYIVSQQCFSKVLFFIVMSKGGSSHGSSQVSPHFSCLGNTIVSQRAKTEKHLNFCGSKSRIFFQFLCYFMKNAKKKNGFLKHRLGRVCSARAGKIQARFTPSLWGNKQYIWRTLLWNTVSQRDKHMIVTLVEHPQRRVLSSWFYDFEHGFVLRWIGSNHRWYYGI